MLPDSPTSLETRPPLSLVYGGGGAVGIAWHLATIEVLRSYNFDVAQAPSIGTSAGSWACGAAELGFTIETLEAFGEIDIPNREPDLLSSRVRALVGETRVQNARIAAVSLPTMRKHLLDSADYPLADLIAASSAVPGVFAPHCIGTTNYIDGGVRSMASAHEARNADLLVVSLPLAGKIYGAVGRVSERITRHAIRRWRNTFRGNTIVLRPNTAIANLVGFKPHSLMSTAVALEVYPHALTVITRRLEQRLNQLASLAT